MGKSLKWSRLLNVIQIVYVWIFLTITLGFHAFPGANKFDIIQSFTPFYGVVLYFLIGVLLFVVLAQKDEQVRTPWALAGFVAWSSLAFVLAEVRTFGFTEMFILWIGAGMFLLLSGPHARNIVRRVVPWFALFALGIHFILGIFAFLQTDHLRFFGLFYNPSIKADAWPNAFASYFLLAFPLAIAALVQIKKLDWLKGLIAGTLLAGFCVSFSRAGFLAFGVEILALLIFFRRDIFKKESFKKVFLVAALAALFSFGGAFFLQQIKSDVQTVTDVSDRLTFSEEAGGTSVTERLEFFSGSLELIVKDPLFGFGPVSFKSVYPQVQKGFLALSDHPHNIVLKYAVERGVMAAVFFVIFVSMLFWNNSPFQKQADVLDRLVWGGVVGLMAHSMVDFNLNFFSIAMLWWMCLVMVGRLRRARFNVVVVLVALLVVGTSGYHVWYRASEEDILNGPTVEKVQDYASILPKWNLIALMNDLDRQDYELRIAVAEKQLVYDHFDHHALAELARIAVEQGRNDDATSNYELLLDVYPKNSFEYYLEYARFLSEHGEEDRLLQLTDRLRPLIIEFRDLEERNVHFIQSKPEGGYVDELETILNFE